MYKKTEVNKKFTKLTHKGVSLIILIFTIIVIIILASVIILTISKNNPIESAKEAQFKEDIRTFQYELNLYISKEYAVTSGKRDKKIDALDFEKIKEYIPSFSEKYRGKFVIQDDEIRYTNKIVEKEKEYLKELNIKEIEPLLPEGYTELEYIESTGTQYIDTNVLSNNYLGCELIFEYTDIDGIQYAIGSLELEKARFSPLFIDNYYSNKPNAFLYTNNISFVPKIYTNKTDTNIHYIKFNCSNSRDIIFDNINYGNVEEIGNSTKATIYLFARNYEGFQLGAKLKMYKCIIYENSIEVCNFIPALDSQGKPCMYDTVTKQSFYNKGTGEFIAGPKK